METNELTARMRRTYDRYFSSGGYRMRYPRPNPATLDFVLAHGGLDAERILDFGCGDGRYSIALLEQTHAHVTAYDISAAALIALDARLTGTPYRKRVTVAGDSIATLGRDAPYDVVLMLFGVLSMIGDRAARVETLSALRRLMHDQGRLVLSVPCIWRRQPVELMLHAAARRLRRAEPPLDEGGSITFSRCVDGQRWKFFYHLYGLPGLDADLTAAGFIVRHCEAESFLPEWCVTRARGVARLDRAICAWLPATLGYGLRVLATPVRGE